MYHSESQSSIDSVGQKPEILLVDDSDELLSILREFFVSNGFATCEASSVNEAIDIIEEAAPDLIVSDVMLAGQLGYSLQQYLLENEYDLPFIFLTSVSNSEERQFALEQGCDAFLEKPFNPEELLAVVKGKLRTYQKRKELSKKKREVDRKKIIHTLSHEFRTPLVSISTGSELLLEHGDSLEKEQLKTMLKSIRRGGLRLERLINDFMILQEINLGRAADFQEKFAREFNLINLLETCVENFSLHKHEQNPVEINLIKSEENQNVRVFAYDLQVEGIIKRLLNNAVKFGASGGIVDISWALKQKNAVISIRDYGPGIERPRLVIKKAFEAFSQIDRESKEQQGCGLGLAIALYFAKINSISLSLGKPKEGQGLLAKLSFPIKN